MNTNITPHHQTFHISSADADQFARLRAGSLVNIFIQSAINSAQKLGFGVEPLRQQNLFWVLSRLSIEIYKPIPWNEQCSVETWPKDLEKILYLRDFILSDTNNQPAAKATSGWLAIDATSKRPKTVVSDDAHVFTQLHNVHALHYAPQKLFSVKDGDCYEIKTSFFDIDFNGHVTSTRYIDWMMDCFSSDFHQKHYPTKLSINFANEIKLGDQILLQRQQNTPTSYSFEGLNKTTSLVAFRGLIEF